MQQQQEVIQEVLYFGEEEQERLKQLIHLLKTKRRKPKPQIIQKEDEEGDQFDTLMEIKENGSNLSSLSSDTHQTYISINITDYEARQLQKMLEDLMKEFNFQQFEKEKYKKAYSEMQQDYQSQIYELQKKNSYSEVVQINKDNDFQDEMDEKVKKNSKKNNNKQKLNPSQIVKSLRELNQKYQKYLDDIRNKQIHNNNNILINQLRHKFKKFEVQQQDMQKEIEILQECEIILNGNEKILQEYDQEMLKIKNQYFQR